MKSEAKVGIFIFLGFISLFLMTTQVAKFNTFGKEGYNIDALLDNVSGLEEKAKIKLNGVNAGYVESFKIDRDKVLLKLFIFKGIDIPKDSIVILSQESMLGGKYIEIIPSQSNDNITQNDILTNQKKLATFNETSENIYQVADELKLFIKELRDTLNGESRDNLKNSFKNIEKITYDLKEVINENRETLKLSIENFNKMTNSISKAGDSFVIAGNTINNSAIKIGNTSDEWKTTANILNNKLPELIKRLDNVGSEFKLVGENLNKDLPTVLDKFSKIEDDLNDILIENKKPLTNALKSADDFFTNGGDTFKKVDKYLAKIEQSEIEMAIHQEYQVNDNFTKSYVSMNYRPNPTKYYMLDFVFTDNYALVDKNNNFQTPTQLDDTEIKISAQFGKKFDNVLLRAGLIENSGGAGIDYFMLNDKLKTSFEIFD